MGSICKIKKYVAQVFATHPNLYLKSKSVFEFTAISFTLGSWVQILAGSKRVEIWLSRDLNPQPKRYNVKEWAMHVVY